jgi:hypothetical protein
MATGISIFTTWDASCMTLKLDGVYPVAGVQGINLGDPIEPGKPVVQQGRMGPKDVTKKLFKGDSGFSLKVLAAEDQDMISYLNSRGGALNVEGYSGVSTTITATYVRGVYIFRVELLSAHIYNPSISGTDSPDGRDPLVCEHKIVCLNRSINDVLDWTDSAPF